jgi:hypothetical protein
MALKMTKNFDKRIKSFKTNNCVFLVMTFNKKTIQKTTEKTRERYIKKFLNEQATDYILLKRKSDKFKHEFYKAIIKPLYTINYMLLNRYKWGIIKVNTKNFYKWKYGAKNNKEIAIHFFNIKDNESNKFIYSKRIKTTKYFNNDEVLELHQFRIMQQNDLTTYHDIKDQEKHESINHFIDNICN